MPVYVFGHRNPDTDAICSAIAYASLLQGTSRPDAVAACCGAPNQRTQFAMERARVESPKIIMDVRPQAGDVCHKDVVAARETDVFYEAYQQLQQHAHRTIPVLNASGALTGILSVLDLLELVFHGDGDPLKTRQVETSLEKICSVLGGTFQHAHQPAQRQDFLVVVGAMSAHGFSERLQDLAADQLLVVSGDRPTIQLPALEHGVRCLVVTGGYQLSPGLLQLASVNDVSIINSPHDTATTTMLIKGARGIEPAVQREFSVVPYQQPIEEARQLMERNTQQLFPVVDDDGGMVGVLSRTDMLSPLKPQIILVDHNELGQSVRGAEDAEILEVIDHHRLGGGLRSSQPIRFVNEPVGSTCTIVATLFRQRGIEPSAGIALCMASGIISDTLSLRSPTTTDVDREVLGWLQSFCSCDLDQYAQEFFAVGSALRSCTPEQVVREDCKEFEEEGRRFSISQIEEIGLDLFWKRQDELQSALAEMCASRRLDFSFLLVTDIVSNGSLLLMSSEQTFWDAIHYPRVSRGLYQLDGVVSRKKQLLPLVIRLLDAPPVSGL